LAALAARSIEMRTLLWIAVLLLAGCQQQSAIEDVENIPIPTQVGVAPKPSHNRLGHHLGYISPTLPSQGKPQQVGEIKAPAIGQKVAGVRAQAFPTRLLDLRLLLVSATANEIEFLTWKAELNRLGVPYDTLVATEEAPLTPARLVNADGSGRYQAVLLTTNNLSYDSGGGNFISAFGNDEWTALFAYERDYGVRQVALYGFPSTFPEDYCTRVTGVEAVQGSDYPVRLTPEGADTFSYLKPTAQIPLRVS
jgi:hypothetical protein